LSGSQYRSEFGRRKNSKEERKKGLKKSFEIIGRNNFTKEG
jgi:hypothetical protein